MSEHMNFADGKYTVINDNGNLTALRHGDPWKRDLIGDNLVYWMLVESLNLKNRCDELSETLQSVTDLLQIFTDNAPPYDEAKNDRDILAKARDVISKK